MRDENNLAQEQLQKISDLTKDYKKVLADHEAPCRDMFTSAVWSKEEHGDLKICEKCSYLKIVYMDKYYEEINYEKNFGISVKLSPPTKNVRHRANSGF